MTHSNKLIFWGAGATAALGIKTTADQTKFIQSITGAYSQERIPLSDRVKRALGRSAEDEQMSSALIDLITILGDREENYANIDAICSEEQEAMRRSWLGCNAEINPRIMHLRLFYDWPALKSVVGICPGSSGDSFKLNDLFNVLDMHGPFGFGVRAQTSHTGVGQFFDSRRLIGATNALRMLLGALFYIDYQHCLRTKASTLDQYVGFAT